MWCSGDEQHVAVARREARRRRDRRQLAAAGGGVEQADAGGLRRADRLELLAELVQPVGRVPARPPGAGPELVRRLRRLQALERVGERRVGVERRAGLEDGAVGVQSGAPAPAQWLAGDLAAVAAPGGGRRRRARAAEHRQFHLERGQHVVGGVPAARPPGARAAPAARAASATPGARRSAPGGRRRTAAPCPRGSPRCRSPRRRRPPGAPRRRGRSAGPRARPARSRARRGAAGRRRAAPGRGGPGRRRARR